MPSTAARRTDRFVAAMGALLLQLGFIAAFLHARPPMTLPQRAEHELIFLLPHLLPKPAIVETATPQRVTATPAPIPLFMPPPAAPASPSTDATVLQNLGHSLFGCAPENYSSLTPEQRAHCPRLGEGMAIQEAPDLLGLPSQVKDNPHWANALAHEKSPLLLPGANPNKFGLTVLTINGDKVSGLAAAVGNGSIADPDNFPSYVDPGQFMPRPPLKGAASTEGVGVHPQ